MDSNLNYSPSSPSILRPRGSIFCMLSQFMLRNTGEWVLLSHFRGKEYEVHATIHCLLIGGKSSRLEVGLHLSRSNISHKFSLRCEGRTKKHK